MLHSWLPNFSLLAFSKVRWDPNSTFSPQLSGAAAGEMKTQPDEGLVKTSAGYVKAVFKVVQLLVIYGYIPRGFVPKLRHQRAEVAAGGLKLKEITRLIAR